MVMDVGCVCVCVFVYMSVTYALQESKLLFYFIFSPTLPQGLKSSSCGVAANVLYLYTHPTGSGQDTLDTFISRQERR